MYAKHWGVSTGEALYIFKLQDSARLLEAELTEKEPEIFAGLWVEHSPSFKIVVAFSSNAEKTIASYLTDDIANVVETRTITYSYKELQKFRNEFQSCLNSLKIIFSSATDVQKNYVVIDILEADQLKIEQAFKDGKLHQTEGIHINTVKEHAKAEVDIYGGRALVGLFNASTSGYAVKTTNGLSKGVTTAGHADNNLIFFYIWNLGAAQELYGGSFDIQWHTCPGLNVVNKIRVWEDGMTLDITDTRFKVSQLIGDTVSKYGDVTHYTAGIINAKDAQLFDEVVPNCLPTYVKIYNIFGYPDLSANDDSGGPWFTGNIAYGTHVAGDDANVYSFYMAIDYISPLGVLVMISP